MNAYIGLVLTDEDVRLLVEAGSETRRVEFKAAGDLNTKDYLAVVARACLAMANSRDGGHIVLGVDDKQPLGPNSGMDSHLVAQWTDVDNVMSKINAYADPPVQLAVAERALPDGRSVVVVEVKEFDLVPVLSKRAHQQNIHVGRLYTRSMAKAETSPQQTPNELRELLQLAVEKGVRAYLQTARNVGFGAALDAPAPFGTERDTYLQRADSQAYIDCPRLMAWVHPVHYRPDQIEYESLQAILNDSAVSADATLPDLRSVERGATYLFGNTHGPALQTWALFQSGQFLLVRPLPTRFGPDPGGVSAGEGGTHYLPISLPVHFITDVAHFAARLQQRVAPDQPFSVSISLVDAQGWQLTARKLGRPFLQEYAMANDNWTQTEILPPYFDEGQHKPVAAELARQLFQRFGWKNASKEVVASVQDSLLDRY